MIFDLRFVERQKVVPTGKPDYGQGAAFVTIGRVLQFKATPESNWQDVPVVTETNNCNANGEG